MISKAFQRFMIRFRLPEVDIENLSKQAIYDMRPA